MKTFILPSITVLSLIVSLAASEIVSAASDTLIKAKGHSAVYLVQDGKRKAFPMLSIYQSWYGNDFSAVVELQPEALAGYQLGQNVKFKSGSLIKLQTDPKVYLVTNDLGALEWIPSEEEFLKRGLSFKNVRDVPDTFFPDYSLAPLVTPNFATPQNEAPQPQGTNIPPVVALVVPEKPVGVISDITVTSHVASANIVADFVFTASNLSNIMLSYSVGETPTSTIPLTPESDGKTFKKTIQVIGGGYTYFHRIDGVDSENKPVVAKGSFVSYSDVVVTSLKNKTIENGPLAVIDPVVGAFSVRNDTLNKIFMNQFVVVFETVSAVTTPPSKTIVLRQLKTDGTLGDIVAEKTVASTVAFINESNTQKLSVAESLAGGETRQYAIVIKNLDQINVDNAQTGDTFKTLLKRIEFGNDLSVSYPTSPLGVLLYKR